MLLYKTFAGSYLYNLNTSDSDVDYYEVYFPTETELLGIKSIQKTKFLKEADEETTRVSLHQFLYQLYKGNHIAYEVLFAPSSSVLFISPFFQELLDIRETLIDGRLLEPMKGYAESHRRNIRHEPSGPRIKYFSNGFDRKSLMHFCRVCYMIKEYLSSNTFNPYIKDNILKNSLLKIKNDTEMSLDAALEIIDRQYNSINTTMQQYEYKPYNSNIDNLLDNFAVKISKKILFLN